MGSDKTRKVAQEIVKMARELSGAFDSGPSQQVKTLMSLIQNMKDKLRKAHNDMESDYIWASDSADELGFKEVSDLLDKSVTALDEAWKKANSAHVRLQRRLR